jgi:signal transduction histidine kinase
MEHPSAPLRGFLGKNTSPLRGLRGAFSRGDTPTERRPNVRNAEESTTLHDATGSPVARAILAAAGRASESIAASTDQNADDVRRQFVPLIDWLITRNRAPLDGLSAPPVVPRDYVTSLRTHLLAELEVTQNIDVPEVVRTLIDVDLAGEAWKQTDRGRFILRLTGSHSVDAVVAIAHDIRSPLCSILLLVDALRRTPQQPADPVRDRYLGLIYGATLGLSTTVNNLILAVRGAGLPQGQPMPFSVAETMMSVSAIVQPMCEEKGRPLEIQPPVADARIGHASVVHQVLLNLASNAVRHTDSGSITMGCTELTGNNVEFWVQDTGPGIPDNVLERFCYGFPPEEVAQRFSGAGLGLAIVRALVEAMGSTLQVDTGPEGTRFCFLLELPMSLDSDRGEALTGPAATEKTSSVFHLLPV